MNKKIIIMSFFIGIFSSVFSANSQLKNITNPTENFYADGSIRVNLSKQNEEQKKADSSTTIDTKKEENRQVKMKLTMLCLMIVVYRYIQLISLRKKNIHPINVQAFIE